MWLKDSYVNIVFIAVFLCFICPAKSRKTEVDQPTILEDAIGIYELESVKKLILNSTIQIKENINNISKKILKNGTADNKEIEKLETKNLVLQESVESLSEAVKSSRGYIEEVFSSVKTSFQNLQKQFAQSFSNLKLYVEHANQQFQSVLRKTGRSADLSLATDCFDLYNMRLNASGSYYLQKFGIRVLCDMETEGGGWLVIQRRAKVTNQVNFQQDWFTYKEGFGSLDTEFWIGNDFLHILTNQKPYEMRLEMEDYENGTFYATYSYFRVGNEESNYVLEIGNYSGNATDAFSYHHGCQFSTMDRDNDKYDMGSCSSYFSGGWWYERCYDTHLNGIYPDPPDRKNASFITWWARNEGKEKVPLVLNNVVIKIRPLIV